MTDSLWSLVHVAAAFALSTALGFGPAYWLMPAQYRRYALLAAPATGYALFSFAAIAVSTNLRLPANTAVWIVFVALGAICLSAIEAERRRGELRDIWRTTRPAAFAVAVMLALVFWPVFYQGTGLYLGTANPDFYQSLAYQEVLARFGIGALDPRPALDYSFDPFFGTFPDAIPAKFGAVMFGLLLDKIVAPDPRSALMTALVVFMLALPAATHLFAKVVLEASNRVAGLAAVLVASAAPVTMSFMHVLIGQNSSLALLPLGLSACYLAVRTRDWRAMLFALLLLEAAFWIYVAILPYIVAPVALYALYDLLRNRRGALRWLAIAVGILAGGVVLLQLGMSKEARQLIGDFVALLGRANRSVYVDFLTEMSLPYSMGLSSYPLGSSLAMARVPAGAIPVFAAGFVAAAMLVLLFYFRCVADWARSASRDARAFVVATLAVYLGVWIYFNFISLYGYAVFKMATWLQFFFMPFIAYGLVRFAAERNGRGARATLDAVAAVAIGGALVLANVLATVDFDLKGLGHDTRKGAIVTSYGIGGNPDYPELEKALARALPPGSVVGIAGSDYIANLWAAYYVVRAGMKASFVSHDDFPDEDAVLPDVDTGVVVNSAGNAGVYKPRYFSPRPAYLLLQGPANLNREIADQQAKVAPLWSNGSFTLVDNEKARDVLLTRRGFYRLEYFDPARFSWWWPDRLRWTAQGGEFLLLNASRPAQPYRLSFVAIVGKEREIARHVEIFLNGRKFDEVELHGASRVVSKPFYPTGGVDRLVARVRERVTMTPRNFGLWNRHIATDQRYLNLMVTSARVDAAAPTAPIAVPAQLRAIEVIDRSARFDGISLDGWVAPNASVDLPLAKPARRTSLKVTVPGWAGFRFPFAVKARINGRPVERQIANPGEHAIAFDFEPADRLVLEMDLAQSTRVPGVGNGSFVLQSIGVE